MLQCDFTLKVIFSERKRYFATQYNVMNVKLYNDYAFIYQRGMSVFYVSWPYYTLLKARGRY